MTDTTTKPVSSWSLEEKLTKVIEYSASYMPEEAGNQVKALLSPESLAIMATVTAAWAISHFFGVGEIADVVMVVSGGAILGASAFQVGHEVVSFALGANNAKDDLDLKKTGEHLGRAVMLGGITLISALFLKAKPKTFHEPVIESAFPLPTGPGPRNGLFRYKPSTSVGPIKQPSTGFIYGVTKQYGDIIIEQSLSEETGNALP